MSGDSLSIDAFATVNGDSLIESDIDINFCTSLIFLYSCIRLFVIKGLVWSLRCYSNFKR